MEDENIQENNENKEDYTREEYIYLSKLYEKAQRYEDMTSSIIKFIELNPKLSKEERNILSAGYKDILLDKRENWRFLNLMERKELKKKSKQATYIKEIKNHIEKEIKKIVEEIHNLIDKYLIINCEDKESKIFYLRLKEDHYRYLCEISNEKELENNLNNAEKYYKEAYELANKDLPLINNERIGLSLNFALFYYEIKGNKKEGYNIAKNCFEETMKYFNDFEKFKAKDALILIQLLKENLIFWSSEMNEEEQN